MTPPRPQLTWSDLPGRRVGLYGLGVEGHASLRACQARGIEPVIVDDRPAEPGVLATGEGGLQALLACDVVIKSPGISRYSAPVAELAEAGVAVVGGLGLWLAGADLTRVLVVTGTKGKSTTTAIAGHLLRQFGYEVVVGGNIGVPPYDPQVSAEADYWVIEVSSYQATDLPVTPPVAAVTSLNPDHLPWHGGEVERYYRDKLSALAQPGAAVTVANGDSPLLREREALLGPRVVWVEASDSGADWTDGLGLLGPHNRRNALIAARALAEMGLVEARSEVVLAEAAAGFDGLPSRLQVVAHRGEVLFVDDSLSTNVLAALAAVEAFDGRRVALLVGGQSRGIDYAPLAALAGRGVPVLLVTMPTNGREIHEAVSGALAGGREAGGAGAAGGAAEAGWHGGGSGGAGGAGAHGGSGLTVVDAGSLQEAVALAAEWADPDGVVLLSPAAPSFDRFVDYRARGAAFTAAALALPDSHSTT